ncbi:unnamed protein product [Nippostrongylus brasiliensis]|uniref:Uncharacterized protein n=1 Tax=Nippostrongylus brasiliensis TaxID=27835 RepID=A0A0N4Y8J5_NIPBR|nr:unnamed protein product [Nippostrongylus brasiliensis]
MEMMSVEAPRIDDVVTLRKPAIGQISPAARSKRIVVGPPARLEQPVDDQPGDQKPEGHARETGLSAHSTKWN